MAVVFLDTEFTSLLDPNLLSVGLVTLDGRECYAELDLKSEVGQQRLAMTPWGVREGVIENKWGLFPESVCDSERSLGLRVGKRLLGVAESDSSGRIELLYDYATDFELTVAALEACSLWSPVKAVISERSVAAETSSVGARLASEACFRSLRGRTPALFRHHALADALALRAAWRMWHLEHERPDDFMRVVDVVGVARKSWLYEWLASPAAALGGQPPIDTLDGPQGLEKACDALAQAAKT